MKLEDKCKKYIIKRLLNVYCEIFGTRSYGGDALASSCILRHMNSCRIFHNIHSITDKYCFSLSDIDLPRLTDKTYSPWICRFCNKLFQSSWHLDRHIRIHTGERPFKCELCGKYFNRKDHLKEHNFAVHTKNIQFKI